jgi:hypothetical protein
MRLQDLLADSDTPMQVVHAADELVALKGHTHELGTATFPAVLRAFVLDELGTTDLADAPAHRLDVGKARAAASTTPSTPRRPHAPDRPGPVGRQAVPDRRRNAPGHLLRVS